MTYERMVNSVIGADRGEFFAECNDKYLEEVNKHIEILYLQFKQELDNNGIMYSSDIARFELARTLFGLPENWENSKYEYREMHFRI